MLLELPTDIFLEYILNQLDVSSLVRLSAVSNQFYSLVNDEYVWRKLCFRDFNLSPDNAFRQTGWKRLYRLLLHPRVYVWGENFDSRLGLEEDDSDYEDTARRNMFRTIVRGPRGSTRSDRRRNTLAYPEELRYLHDKSIVDIVSGGWSFHALDKYGFIWFWGSMQQDLTLSHSLGVKRVRKAQKLGLPDPNIRFSSVSSGRRHAIGLCKDGSVYHWTNCERIQKIDLPVLEVAQVSANWEHSSILTKDGQVFSIPRPDFIRPSAVDREVPHTVINNELGVNFQSLLVDRNVFENPDPNDRDEFVQIAGILGQTIALTKNGRVLKLSTEDALGFSTNPTQHAIELTRFSSNGNNKFVAGNHHSFGVCTSDGKVLLGHVDSQRDTPPTTFTEFDGHNVCKMSFGDYHYGAITTEGKLFTWGRCDSKALGHGHEVNALEKPKIVEHLNDKFVFAIGFGGWQSSVLAIDLNE